jgi:hypothetical protein
VAQTQQAYLTGGLGTVFGALWGIIPGDLLKQSGAWLAGGAAMGFGLPALATPLLLAFPVLAPVLAVFAVGTPMLALIGGVTAGGAFGGISSGGLEGALSGLASPLFLIIILLALLFTFIRLFFLLLNSYIQIIISIIFAPIQLLFEAVPGQSSFTNWLKGLISNLIVFPTVVLLLEIAQVINHTIGQGSGMWVPPLLPGWSGNLSRALIGLGFAMLIPSLAGAVKDAFKAKPAIPVGAGSAVAPVMTGVQTGLSVLQQFYYGQAAAQALGIGKPRRESRGDS